jgi:hypothetical protein
MTRGAPSGAKGEDVARPARGEQPTPGQQCEAVAGAGRQAEVVGDDEGAAARRREFPDQREHLDAVAQIEMGRGLVEQQDLGILGQRPGDQHELSLAAGQLENGSVGEFGDPHPLHGALRALDVGRRLVAERTQVRRPAHQHDLTGAEGKGDLDVLGDHRQLPRQGASRQRLRASTAHADASGGRPQHPRGDAEESRLAGAVAAGEHEDLAREELEVDVAQNLATAELDGDPLEGEGCRALPRHAAKVREWCRRSSHRKSGPPAIAVMAPTGSSRPASRERAMVSHSTRKAAPPTAAAGTSRR